MTAAVDAVHGGEAERWGGWSWREPSRGEHFRRCSYCGSVNPEDLAAEAAWRAEWADMKYGWPHKFYVDIPNRDPDALFVTSSATSHLPPTAVYGEYVAWADLSPEQLAAAERDGYTPTADGRRNFLQFGTRPNHWGKFYSVHLADPALDPAVIAAIEHVSGVHFTFADGRVSWGPAPTREVTP